MLSPLKGVASSNLLLQLTLRLSLSLSLCVLLVCRQGCNLVPIIDVTPLFQTLTPDNAGIKAQDVSSMLTAEDKQLESPPPTAPHIPAPEDGPQPLTTAVSSTRLSLMSNKV